MTDNNAGATLSPPVISVETADTGDTGDAGGNGDAGGTVEMGTLNRVTSHSNGHSPNPSVGTLKGGDFSFNNGKENDLFDEEIVGSGCSKVFLQLTDAPTEKDISNNTFYEKHCQENDIPYQAMATREEIWGWYIYDWANSPMWQIALSLTFPTYLATLATRYACQHNVPFECDYYDDPINSDKSLWVYMGEWSLKPSSYAAAMISISSMLQAVAYIAIGGLADYGNYQHYLFRICALIAAFSNLFWYFFATPDSYLLAGWWGATSVIFFGLSLVFYNAFLGPIVTNHWRVRRAVQRGDSHLAIAKLEQTVTDEMSQFGYGCGYCGSLVLTIVVVVMFFIMADYTTEMTDVYGNDSDSVVTNTYEELWAKPVVAGTFYYQSNETMKYISGIQFYYDEILINGDFYGEYSNDSDTFNVTLSKDYIKSIQLWQTKDSIPRMIGMQFTYESGIKSQLFGDNSTINENSKIKSSTIESTYSDFVVSGYTVYAKNDKIVGFSFMFMNADNGQYGSTLSYRMSMMMVGLWWIIFQLYSFKHLKNRPKQELPSDTNVLTVSTKEFYHTIKRAAQYPHMFRYLIAFFMFSDGINTIASVGILFGQAELGMTATELVLILIESEILAAIGNVFFIWFQKKVEWNAKQMLMMHLVANMFLPFYSLIGLIPNATFGLVNKWEMYAFVAWFAIHLGSIQSYSRTIMSYLIPMGYENQMFALYEITDKGSSWIGPLMVAIINNIASMRWAVFYVVWLFVLPMPFIIWGVDMKKGMKQAGRYRMRKRNDPNWARISMTLSNLSSIQKDINDVQNVPTRLSISIENADYKQNDKGNEEFDQETADNTQANSTHNKANVYPSASNFLSVTPQLNTAVLSDSEDFESDVHSPSKSVPDTPSQAFPKLDNDSEQPSHN